MSGIPPQLLAEPLTTGLLSLLRHELVSPINLIVGYCELLMAEASDWGESRLIAPLNLIRQSGFLMLNSIDRVLLTDVNERSLADIQELARTLIVPASQLVDSCDTIGVPADHDGAETDFTNDLARIRSAGRRMCLMAEDLAVGVFPQADDSRV